jgi:hypothetical protein
MKSVGKLNVVKHDREFFNLGLINDVIHLHTLKHSELENNWKEATCVCSVFNTLCCCK